MDGDDDGTEKMEQKRCTCCHAERVAYRDNNTNRKHCKVDDEGGSQDKGYTPL